MPDKPMYSREFYEEFHQKFSMETVISPTVRYEADCIGQELLSSGSTKQGQSLLDVGCGNGVILKLMARAFPDLRYFGIDISTVAIRAANYRRNLNQYFVIADVTHLPFCDQTFDYIVSHDCLEHIDDDEAAIREMVRVLKRCGKLSLAVPNADYFPIFRNYVEKMARICGHLRLYNKDDILRRLGENGLQVIGFKFGHHIVYYFVWRYLWALALRFSRFSHLGLCSYNFMVKILKSLLNLENKLITPITTSHLELYLVVTKP